MTPETAVSTLWIAWVLSWVAAAAWSDRAAVKRRTGRRQVGSVVLAILVVLLILGMFSMLGVNPSWRSPVGLKWAMVAVIFAGFLFTWWARIHLGRLWSGSISRKADHHVVETGPYAIVRHPIYAGLLLALAGTAVLRGTTLAWVFSGLMTTSLVIKARQEEKFLREELGAEAYADYARRVPMFVPRPGRKNRSAGG